MKYPFSPEILDAMPEKLAELYRELEVTLLEEISAQLVLAGKSNTVTIQHIQALRSHGIPLDEIKKAIQQTTKVSSSELNKLFEDVIAQNQKYYTKAITLADITVPEALVDAETIAAVMEQTHDEINNITRSMGFLVDNGRTMLPPAKAYQWALDNASMQIASGAVSYNKAIANATRQLADSGLRVVRFDEGYTDRIVKYESGHIDHADVAVRRAVMTGINQVNRQYDEAAMRELKTDLVEVSAHAGARDKGEGFENHKEWQGRIYRWAKFTEMYPGASKGEYDDFEETCGLGDVQGILGANCRHSYHAFIEDVMEPTYTEEQLKNIDPPDFKYEGKKYTHYEATQKQREIERTIRKWKRIKAAATTPEDKQTAEIRIRRLTEKYNEFSEAADLRKQPERMRVYA